MRKASKSNPFTSDFMVCMVSVMLLIGCTSSVANISRPERGEPSELEDHWGVRLEGVRLTASGHLVDFRYRVLDPDKAQGMMRRGEEAYLLDQASGAKLSVPLTKVGQLRGTGTKPAGDRVYAVMFNSGGIITPGSVVTVVLGDFRAENLIVQ